MKWVIIVIGVWPYTLDVCISSFDLLTVHFLHFKNFFSYFETNVSFQILLDVLRICKSCLCPSNHPQNPKLETKIQVLPLVSGVQPILQSANDWNPDMLSTEAQLLNVEFFQFNCIITYLYYYYFPNQNNLNKSKQSIKWTYHRSINV